MPYGNGTGPDGRGPRTGRGFGNCPPQAGFGGGYGRGYGRGRADCPVVPITKEEEAEMLKKQKSLLLLVILLISTFSEYSTISPLIAW